MNVRYDGGHKLDHYLRDTLGQFIEWVPVCPEVESGLSIPREPMQLVGDSAKPRLVGVETKKDHTTSITRWAGKKLKHLEQGNISGFVLKARSPSCGVHDTKLFSLFGKAVGERAGLFAEALRNRFPSMPVEDEEKLRDPGIRGNFIERVFVYHRWMDLVESGGSARRPIQSH